MMTASAIRKMCQAYPAEAIHAVEATGILRKLAALPQSTVATVLERAPEASRELLVTVSGLIEERAAIAELAKMGPTQLQHTLATFRPSERQALIEVLERHA